MTTTRSLLLKASAVAAIYALLDLLSAYPALQLPFLMEAVWLPSGFIFAVLMRSPRREWAGLLGGVAFAALLVNLSQNWTLVPAIGFALTDPVEVLLGAWVACALLKGRAMDLSRIPDTLILGLGAVLNGLVAGPAGLLAARIGHAPLQSPYIGAIWSCSVLLSHFFIAPLILAWPPPDKRRSRMVAESILWMAAAVVITRWGLHSGASSGLENLLMFLPFPIMVGAALRTGPWGVALSLSLVSFTALVEGSHGHGPLPVQLLAPDLMMVWIQLFLATQAASIMVLACTSAAQRRTEGSLLESESRYRNLVEQFPHAILLREGSRIRYANPAARKLAGVEEGSELEGHGIYELFPPSDTGSGEFPNLSNPIPADRKRTLKTLDGRSIPVEVTDIAVELEGRPLTLDVLRDLSMREALQQSEEDFRRFFDRAPLALLISVLEDGRVLRANQTARDLFEFGDGDLSLIRTLDYYANPADRGRIIQLVREKGKVDGVELDIVTVKGRAKRLLLSTAPIRFEGREVLLSGYMDLTPSRKAEEALRQAQKMESLGLLAGGVAHDFNNLLTALTGNLEIAQSILGDQTEAQPFLENMSSTLRRAAELARQMLAYSGRSHLRKEPVDLNQLLEEQARILSVSLSKKVQLRFELAKGLPFIEADPAQVRQVFMNLVTNASEAIGDKEGSITLRTRLDHLGKLPEEETLPGQSMEPGTHVAVEVEDTGCGMSPEVQARIYDPFFTTKPTGRGLGLSAMLGILRSHHAGVRILSVEGKGTTFRVFFPAAGNEILPPPAPARSERRHFDGTVLLVDDEADVRQSAGALLRMMGFEVVEAGDGREALSKLDQMSKLPALVLLDLSMPRMDGAEALERLREMHPWLPVVLCSGYDAKQSVPRLMELGHVHFLQKLYHLSSLQETLALALSQTD